MNVLLFFVFPLATIIYSIVLQKLIKSPILVSLTIFATFLIVTFTAYDESFLIYTILYTALSYLVSIFTKLLRRLLMKLLDTQEDSASSDYSDSSIDVSESVCECNNRLEYSKNNYFPSRKCWK